MSAYATQSFEHVTDEVLTRDLQSWVGRERVVKAELLARLAEFDARRLYVPAGYPSMHAYCVGVLKFSDDEAYKRIQVARAGRTVPKLLVALSEGRIHLTAARILAAHITTENADELIENAAQRSKFELELWFSGRFSEASAPSFEFPRATPAAQMASTLVPGPVEFAGKFETFETLGTSGGSTETSVARHEVASFEARQHEAASSEAAPPEAAPSAVAPLQANPPEAVEWVLVQYSLRRTTHAKVHYARQLLGHAIPSGDVDRVLERALDLLIARLEKQKFAATTRPRVRKNGDGVLAPADAAQRPRHRTRTIPSDVKRAVWQRDGGRCTFVASSGHRCEARHRIEYDHVEPFAWGGSSTVEGLRLRCRAHNQYEAEQTFGAEFVHTKREAARFAAEERKRAAVGDAARLEAQPAPV
jgi:hypothetical protein